MAVCCHHNHGGCYLLHLCHQVPLKGCLFPLAMFHVRFTLLSMCNSKWSCCYPAVLLCYASAGYEMKWILQLHGYVCCPLWCLWPFFGVWIVGTMTSILNFRMDLNFWRTFQVRQECNGTSVLYTWYAYCDCDILNRRPHQTKDVISFPTWYCVCLLALWAKITSSKKVDELIPRQLGWMILSDSITVTVLARGLSPTRTYPSSDDIDSEISHLNNYLA
jgi:hypothetical protein